MRRTPPLLTAVLVWAAGLGSILASSERHSNQAVLNQMWSAGRQGAPGEVRLSFAPLRLEDIGTMAPLGMMVGEHVTPSDHMGFGPHDFTQPTDRFEVIAPADGFIVSVTRGRARGPGGIDDYLLILEHSGSFYTWIGLINHLPPFITVITGENLPYGGWQHVRIPVEAGQVIGRFGGNHGIDFSVINTDVTLTGFVFPEHYDREPWKIHVVDFFDYVDEPLRSELLAINKRKAEPLGGKIDYDVDGTLSGNWFVEGTNWVGGPPGAHATFGRHHIDPTQITVSLGNFGGQARQFWVVGNAPDSARVTPETGPVRYELVYANLTNGGDPFDGSRYGVLGVVRVEMLPVPAPAVLRLPLRAGGLVTAPPSRRVRLEAFPGLRAAQVTSFTSAARVYER